MVSLFFVNKFLTALVTGKEVPNEAQLPWIPYEISKVELFLSSFEKHEQALLDWMHQRTDDSAQWHKYASSFGLPVRRLFEASGRIKSELRRRRLFDCFESD